MAQVMFGNNPLSGLLITAALFLQHPQQALGGLLATIVSTVSAVILKENRSADISVFHFHSFLFPQAALPSAFILF